MACVRTTDEGASRRVLAFMGGQLTPLPLYSFEAPENHYAGLRMVRQSTISLLGRLTGAKVRARDGRLGFERPGFREAGRAMPESPRPAVAVSGLDGEIRRRRGCRLPGW